MVESDKQKCLKDLGKRILMGMGVPYSNIYTEHTLHLKNISNEITYVIADLVGWNDNEEEHTIENALIIECGDLKAEKLTALQSNCKFVLHLPYSIINDYNLNDYQLDKLSGIIENVVSRILDDKYRKTTMNFDEKISLMNHIIDRNVKIDDKIKNDVKLVKDSISEFKVCKETLDTFFSFVEEMKDFKDRIKRENFNLR